MEKFNLLKKIVLVLGIVIVLNLFFNYGIETFYDAPKYDDFCQKELQSKTYENQESCEEIGGFWSASGKTLREPYRGEIAVPANDTKEGWCNEYYTCQKEYETARDFYNRNVFIILLVLGMTSIVTGFMVTTQAVSAGLSFGGILSLVIGSMRYWSAMDEYLRFIILGLALAVLIWMGMKKFSE